MKVLDKVLNGYYGKHRDRADEKEIMKDCPELIK